MLCYPIRWLDSQWLPDSATDETRRTSAQKLCIVAKALGAERSRSELLPFIVERLENIIDKDDMLAIVAEQLGEFVNYVGGAEFSSCLISPLVSIAEVDETCVRDKVL